MSLLSRQIQAYLPDLSSWTYGKRPVPVKYCIRIEAATQGLVTRQDLRPHDWHEIWVELKDKTPQPDQGQGDES